MIKPQQDRFDASVFDADYVESARMAINADLGGFTQDYEGVSFCESNAGLLFIKGRHAKVKGVSFPLQTTPIKSDLSNIGEAIVEFCRKWREEDTPEGLAEYESLLADMRKHGND